jgi:hypothetical protein
VSAPSGAERPGEQASASLGTPALQPGLQSGFGATGVTGAGGIIGVTSKSKDTSIKIYNGRDRYNEWSFVYLQTTQSPGGPPGGPSGPPRRNGQDDGPGQQGQPFGMPPGSFPGQGQRPGGMQQSPFSPFPNGQGQPSRPPVGAPGGSGVPGTPPFPPPPGQARPPG